MPSTRMSASTLAKTFSNGGLSFGVPPEWTQAMFGSGWPIMPVQAPKDIEIPRSIDYPISVNSTLTPRTGYGLMPFASILEAYENITEVKMPVSLIYRELTSFIPRLVDSDGNEVTDHPYSWMCKTPDRKTPYGVWQTRLLKNSKVYDSAALYLNRDNNGVINGMHYIDGSTLFVIVDEYGNIPKPETMDTYLRRSLSDGISSSHPLSVAGTRGPSSLSDFLSRYRQRLSDGKSVPDKVPAFTQIIKGTPFSWWSADDIWYMPNSPRMNAPYGESFIESAWSWIMIIVNITAFELGHYKTGSMPEGFVTVPKDTYSTPDKILAAELLFNARMSSNPATERMRLRFFPDGTKYIPTKKPDFPDKLYSQAWKNILHIIGIPPSEFGDIPGGGLGGKGFKEGAATDLSRNTLNPHRNFIASPFNYVLEQDGVDDVTFELGYPTEEIDPDKLKDSVYEGMAHGTLSLNDGLGQMGLNPVGNPDDRSNIANKHLIVAGANIFVIEEMQTQNGMAVPTLGQGAQNLTGAKPVDPETVVEQSGKEHTSEDFKTLQQMIQNLRDTGTLSGKTISVPSGKTFSQDTATKPVEKAKPVQVEVVAKADATHSDGAMIAVMIPSEAAKQLRQITESIGLPDTATLETTENMHVTLAFLPDASAAQGRREGLLACIGQVAQSNDVLDGKIQGFGVFNGKDGTKVLFALLDEPQLPFIRTAICEGLDAAGIEYGKDYGFVPHITMAYFPESFELPAGFNMPDIPVTIDAITLAFGTDYTPITLGRDVTKLAKHCGVCAEDDDYFGAPISREVEFNFPNTAHANGVEIVAMCPEGLPPKAALWKPEGGEVDDLQDWIGGAQYMREEAAYLVDRSLGFMLAPVAYVAESYGEQGAAVYYTYDMSAPLEPNQYSPFWIERAAVFDCVIGQQDRGYHHNYGGHPDDTTRMILFDNGLCFPANGSNDIHSPFYDLMSDKPLSDHSLQALALCLHDTATWQDVAVLVGSTAVAAARTRIKQMLERKCCVGASESLVYSTNGSSGL